MAGIEQVLNYVKNITETLNQWAANAKKTEELPVMVTMDPEGLLIVSQLVDGIWTSKQLEIQKIIEGISRSGQDNRVREVLLGTITTVQDLNYLLDNTGITVTENEIIFLTALANVNATLIQRQFLWKLGKGTFNPIGSANVNTKLIELQPKFLNEITSDELTSSPSAIVYDFGVITDSILDVININPAYNYTDDEKIYYIRAIKDGVKLLYNFIGINGIYGNGASQMTEADLVLVYSSANTDMTELFVTKRESQDYLINYFDAVVEEVYLSDERASLSFTGSNTDVKSIRLSEEFMRLGKLFTFKNRQTIPVTFWHNSGTGNVKMLFPNEENFVLNPNEIIQFSLNINDSSTPKLEYIGVDGGVGLPIDITDVTGLTAELDSKLDAADYNQHFKGVYLTEAALFAAHPTASVGDYAQVNEVGATDVLNYNWDAEESAWVKNAVAGSGATNTDALPEGTINLYFTVARFLASLTYANVIVALGFTPENTSNKSQDIETDKASTIKFGSVKAFYDWCVGRFQPKLVAGLNISIDNTNPLAPVISSSGGGGVSTVSQDKAVLFAGSSIFFFGDSFTSGYASLFSNANNLTGNILGVSGAGWREAIFRSYVNVSSFNNSTFSVVMAGLNDLRYAGNNAKTFEKIKSSARALIVNNFLKTAIPANSGSITASGTWTTTSGITDKASNSLSGLVRVSGASGSTLTYTFISPNLVIGTFSTDEVTTLGGDFSYAIDGGTPITYSGKNKTDGVTVGGNNNSLVPNVIVIRGLSTGAHTVVITSLETAPARIDYIGTLLPTEICAPVIVSDIPYLNAAGYITAPANASIAITDLGNAALADVVNEFKGFPVYGYKINDFYNSISGDNIHPSNLGYVQIANGLQTVIKAGNTYSSANPLIASGSNGNKGYLTNGSDITALGSNFNPITGEIPVSVKASSAIYLGALASDSYIDFYTSASNNAIPSRRMRLNKDGKLSIGNTNTTYNFDLSGTARITGETIIQGGLQVLGGLVSPIGSGGFELEYTGGTAYMTAYNRAGGSFLPLSIRASSILFTNVVTAPKLIMTGVVELKSYTVGDLPSGTPNAVAVVTDAVSPTYLGTLTGGGSIKCPVFYNGTAWVSF